MWIAVDNDFNRYWNKHLIGKVFPSDHLPSYTAIKEIHVERQDDQVAGDHSVQLLRK